MTSQLANLYDQLEAMSVTFTNKAGASKTATVYSQETHPDQIQTAHLPCRILAPSDGGIAVQAGGLFDATHNISDLALLAPVGQGTGTKDEAGTMTRYVVAYLAALAPLWQPAYQYTTEQRAVSANYVTGKFEFPTGSGVYFYGVRFDLTLAELA